MTYSECVYYAGGNGQQCRAGVTISTLRDAELRLPCVIVNGHTGEHRCDELRLPEAKLVQLTGIVKALADLEAGRCSTCSEPIMAEHDFGRVVKAQPCDHVLADRRRR